MVGMSALLGGGRAERRFAGVAVDRVRARLYALAMAHIPKKSLGQNFLHDVEVARWIADQIDPENANYVIEIGPGQGALTEHLAGRCRALLLIEKDDDLAPLLQERFVDAESVGLWHGDATRFDARPLFRQGGVKLIGNLPYSMGNGTSTYSASQ